MRKVFAIFFLSTSSEVSSKKGGGRNKVGETSTAFFFLDVLLASLLQPSLCTQGLLLFDKAEETCGGGVESRAESF